MQWNDLQTLLAVANGATLAAAGATLGVDRTTISRRIVALEERLNTALFVRTRDGLVMTPAGKRVLASVEQMAEAAKSVERGALADQALAGVVRVACTEALAPLLIEQGLLDIAERYPSLHVELLAGNRRLDLEKEEADLAVRLDPFRGASLRVRCLARMPLGVFAAPSYLRSHPVARANDLSGHSVLLPSAELSRLPEARFLASIKNVRVAFSSNSPLALLAAAKQGLGLVALTLPWGEREPGLERVMILNRLPVRAIWLVTTQSGAKRPAVAAVADHLASRFTTS